MDFIQALDYALSQGEVNFKPSGAGSVMKDARQLACWFSRQQFTSVIQNLKNTVERAALKAKYPNGTKVRISGLVGSIAGLNGKIASTMGVDMGDMTVLVYAEGIQRAWLKDADLTILPPFDVKDDVIINLVDEDGDVVYEDDAGIIVKVSSDPNDPDPYLVYSYDQDDTSWLPASALKKA